ncbi:UDP-3-O-acyl-N-acetylglucosamine deacetylase [Thermodesulfobacteriota bacterium]
MDIKQRTLNKEIGCTGVGLHCGEKVTVNIKPASANTGIRFVRVDLEGQPSVGAKYENVLDTTLATTIGKNGCSVSTIEHLMAAFFGMGIDNAIVELDGREVPVMDGSSAPFVFLIKSAGIRELNASRRFILIRKPFKIQDEDRSISIYPSKEVRISYRIDYDHPLLKDQNFELSFSGKDFVREISSARTFGFLKDVEMLKENGFAKGGSLDNAVVIDDFTILNEDGLRFKDEFVRHKILDFIGDLSIVGCPIIGHFEIDKSGHFFNQYMLQNLMASEKYWKSISFENPQEFTEDKFEIPGFTLPEAVSV